MSYHRTRIAVGVCGFVTAAVLVFVEARPSLRLEGAECGGLARSEEVAARPGGGSDPRHCSRGRVAPVPSQGRQDRQGTRRLQLVHRHRVCRPLRAPGRE